MKDTTVGSTRPNPLLRPLRKPAAAGVIGMAITASTLLGAGSAAAEPDASTAEPAVANHSVAILDATEGQEIAVATSTMDTKLRTALLIAMPLQSDEAEAAVDAFREQPPVTVATATDGTEVIGGSEIAEAAEPLLSELGLPEDKVDEAATHFNNLVSVGNSVTVRGVAPEPPPEEEKPAPPPSEEVPPPPPEQPPSNEVPSPEQPAPPPEPAPSDPGSAVPPPPSAPMPSPKSVPLPSTELMSVPQDLPAWSDAQFGQVPGFESESGRLGEGSQEPTQQDQAVRDVGKAEAVSADSADRVAMPMLLAAVSIAGVTAALVRRWVLRRA